MNEHSAPRMAASSLEHQIAAWRSHLRKSHTITPKDATELEDHLREQIAALVADGLSEDEAFLVAVKRMGAIDALTREFAREHSDRLWKQLMLSSDGDEDGSAATAAGWIRRMWLALGLAVGAALAIQAPRLFGLQFDSRGAFFPLNFSFFTLPFIATYFVWDRRAPTSTWIGLAGLFAAAALIVNAFPFQIPMKGEPHTAILTTLHLPIALWLGVGVSYAGGGWWGSERRMDFIRFTGELFIYYVLIALGGGVLMALTFNLFHAIGIKADPFIQNWILPCGITGATVVATWLVEAKQSVIENMAPVLTKIFTPLFAILLIVFLATLVVTGRRIDTQREVLIIFDLLLAVVFGLLLYSLSARDAQDPPGFFDWIQLTLVVAALVVDAVALWAIGTRISSFGMTPNRVAALGENIVLLANLGGSVFLYAQFLRGRGGFAQLCRWQMFYLYVLAVWAAAVALIFPLAFGFI